MPPLIKLCMIPAKCPASTRPGRGQWQQGHAGAPGGHVVARRGGSGVGCHRLEFLYGALFSLSFKSSLLSFYHSAAGRKSIWSTPRGAMPVIYPPQRAMWLHTAGLQMRRWRCAIIGTARLLFKSKNMNLLLLGVKNMLHPIVKLVSQIG